MNGDKKSDAYRRLSAFISGPKNALRPRRGFSVQHFADPGQQCIRREWLVQEGNRRLLPVPSHRLVAISRHVEDLQLRRAFLQRLPQFESVHLPRSEEHTSE